jgi:integrase
VALTQRWLAGRDPKSGKRRDETAGRWPDGNRLFLKITKTGKRYWTVRIKLKGRDTELSVGPYEEMTIEAARLERDKLVGESAVGRHPRGGWRTSPTAAPSSKVPTFGETAEKHIAANERRWSRRHAQHWRSTIQAYCATIVDVPVADVTAGMILEILEPIWTTKPATAHRLRAQIEAALAAGYVRLGLDRTNPARWKGWLDKSLAKIDHSSVRHHPALPYADVPALMDQLRSSTGSVAAQCLAFAILTATRTQEARLASWVEIRKGRLWVIPKERMKKRRELRVPLSDAAVEILERRHQAAPDSKWVFTASWSEKPLSSGAMAKFLDRMGLDNDATVHGFRASFRSWCKSQGENFEAAEEALAHVSGNKTVKAYDRDDMLELRGPLMARWAEYCMSSPGPVALLPAPSEDTAEVSPEPKTLSPPEGERIVEAVDEIESRTSHGHASWPSHFVVVEHNGDLMAVVEHSRVYAYDDQGAMRSTPAREKAVLKAVKAGRAPIVYTAPTGKERDAARKAKQEAVVQAAQDKARTTNTITWLTDGTGYNVGHAPDGSEYVVSLATNISGGASYFSIRHWAPGATKSTELPDRLPTAQKAMAAAKRHYERTKKLG